MSSISNWFNGRLIFDSLKSACLEFSPQVQFRNPVIFVTYIGAILAAFASVNNFIQGSFNAFEFQITLWLWIIVFLANFSKALAQYQGKVSAVFLRRSQSQNIARKLVNGDEIIVPASELKKGDFIVCQEGDIIPLDGEVVSGIALVDEAAITGESAPVIRESGSERNIVTIGTRIVSDRIIVQVISEKGKSFLDRMTFMISGRERPKAPNEVSLGLLLSGLTLIFLLVVVSLKFFIDYSPKTPLPLSWPIMSLHICIAMFVCLIPSTVSALSNAVEISGINRLINRNVLVENGRYVEMAGDIDVLLVDKTSITLGNRMAVEFIPAPGVDEKELAEAAQQASLSDETPEGRSIVVLAKNKFDLRGEGIEGTHSRFYPFSLETRVSGLDLLDNEGKVIRSLRKGPLNAIAAHVERIGGTFSPELNAQAEAIVKKGGLPILVSDDNRVLGIVMLKEIIKGGIHESFNHMRKMGIRTIMLTIENPINAAAIAAGAGVDDFIPHATLEMKLARIREEQNLGRTVALIGDGIADARALVEADVGVALNVGLQAHHQTGNMVDLDNNPTKIIEIVEIGKQLLITRGALTTFSLANNIAKYCAIIPAILAGLYVLNGKNGPLSILNILHLNSPQSAILSTLIFDALIILAFIPLSLKGAYYRAQSADALLKRSLCLYGIGGIVLPFLAIKLIEVSLIHLGAV